MSASMAGPVARRIVLCADDYGLAPGVDAAIRELIARGRLNATSVMVLPQTFSAAEAARLDALNVPKKRAAIGLHVTLTAPFRPLTGFSPLAPDGAFLPIGKMLVRAHLKRPDPAVVAREIDAQTKAFVAAFGRPPDFVDGHQHVHLLPGVREAFLDVVKRSAPGAWVRQCAGRRGALLRAPGDPKGFVIDRLGRRFRRKARRAGVATNTLFAGTYTFRPGTDYAAVFPRFLTGLRDGGLIMCHPGTVDDELTRLDPLTSLRETEYAFLGSDAFFEILARHGFALAEGGRLG